MRLTGLQTLLIILSVALGCMSTRFVPFFIFPENKKPPETVIYLGKILPPAMMGLLVVYCIKDVSFLRAPYGIPEISAVVLTAAIHLWKGNVLLSIAAGTAFYMFLVQAVF